MSALHALVGLAAALTNADSDGRVVIDAAAHTAKFVLLNAAALFGKVHSPAQSQGRMRTNSNRTGAAEPSPEDIMIVYLLEEASCHVTWDCDLRASASLPTFLYNKCQRLDFLSPNPTPRRQVVAAAHAVVLVSGTCAGPCTAARSVPAARPPRP